MRTRSDTSGTRSRWAAALLLPVLAAAACDDGTDVSIDDIAGVWVASQSGGAEYLVISDDTFLYYQKLDTEDCADVYAFDLSHEGGNVFRLTARYTSGEVDVTLDAADGRLSWPESWGATSFVEETEVDPTAFPVCAGGGDDVALACSALPEIPAAQDVAGDLSQQDPVERGRYYDVYRFEPTVAVTSTVTAGSSDFDTYLYLYDAGGALIAENDDAGLSTEDSSITFPFEAACYRVEVSSFDPGATGAYTLRAE